MSGPPIIEAAREGDHTVRGIDHDVSSLGKTGLLPDPAASLGSNLNPDAPPFFQSWSTMDGLR